MSASVGRRPGAAAPAAPLTRDVVGALIGCVAAVSAGVLSARGQELLGPEFNTDALENLSGQNAAQRDMADSIDDVCPTLVRSENQDRLSPDQEDLRDVCTVMVFTALDLEDDDTLGDPSGQTLEITEEETNNALQAINGEELQNPQQQIVEIRDTLVASLQARIDAIRTGTVGPGLSLAGLNLGDGDRLLAAAFAQEQPHA